MKNKSSKKIKSQETSKNDMAEHKIKELKERLRNQKSILKKILKILDQKQEIHINHKNESL